MTLVESKIKDLPDYLLLAIVKSLMPYTVGVYRGEQQLGTATLIQCDGRKGLLTAHHVIHRPNPPLDITPTSTEKLLLAIMEQRHSFQIPAKYLQEIEIGIPVTDPVGPDLTFIEIPPGDELGTLTSIKSFWNLDYKPEERIAYASDDSGVWVKIGLPNEWEKSEKMDDHTIEVASKFIGFFGSAESSRRYEENGYDFVDTEAHYGGIDKLPSSFGGLSGGGLWKIKLLKNSVTGIWEHGEAVFCGVPFYEEANSDGVRVIRCHYVKSVYVRGRNAILEAGNGAA